MPLRERNALLLAAGFAPEYPETPLDTPELTQVRRAIDFTLEHQEPYPAFVLNRRWDVLCANRAAARIGAFLIGGSAHTNVMRQFFDPRDLRAVVVNWEEVAGDLIRHLHEEVAAVPTDAYARALLDGCSAIPAPTRWRTRDLATVPLPVLTVPQGRPRAAVLSTITVRHLTQRHDRRAAHRVHVSRRRHDGGSSALAQGASPGGDVEGLRPRVPVWQSYCQLTRIY